MHIFGDLALDDGHNIANVLEPSCIIRHLHALPAPGGISAATREKG